MSDDLSPMALGGGLPPGEAPAAARLLRQRLFRAHLYLITPAEPEAGGLNELLPRVLENGVDMVQLRDKDLEAGPLLRFCEVVRRRTSEFGALFVVNDRVDVAIAAGADGVHLGQDDLPVDQARCQLGAVPLIGLSTHSEDQFLQAAVAGVDYAAVGPVFATPTKPGRPGVGLGLVGFAADRAVGPVFAIGGIDSSNLSRLQEAGASRVAVVRALTSSRDPGAVAAEMSKALGTGAPRCNR